MTTTSWAQGVNGNWINSESWTAGLPTASSTAFITAGGNYTVTSGSPDSAGNLELAKHATISVIDEELQIALGGTLAGTIAISNAAATLGLGNDITGHTTFNNTGAILLGPGNLAVSATVTLTGKGVVNLSGGNGSSQIVSDGLGQARLTNVSNTISGSGTIGDPFLSFTNAPKGIVDATGINGNGGLLIIDTESFTNDGELEATNSSELLIESTIEDTFNARVRAVGDGDINLQNATLSGGVISISNGSILNSANAGVSFIDATTAIANDGLIDADEGTLIINASIKNDGNGVLSVNNGYTLSIAGNVTNGTANIGASGLLIFGGASSANVIFGLISTGTLKLDDATKFTGTVAGMLGNPGAGIDLENIVFANSPVVSFNATQHLLTVTDPVTGITDTIKISGPAGTFTPSMASDGSTLIKDPPANAASVPNDNAQLLVQAMASFGASSGIAGSGEMDSSPNQVLGNISGFATGDAIDLGYLPFNSAYSAVWAENGSNTGGTLNIMNGASTVTALTNLTGSFTSANFQLSQATNGTELIQHT